MMEMFFSRFRCSRAWVACAAALCLGCGGEPMGQVSGRVMLEGEPVASGLVGFQNDAHGVHILAPINSDGSYEVKMAQGKGLPLGTYRVFVAPPLPELQMGAPDPDQQPEELTQFPPRYLRSDTSGITITVERWQNSLDIDMQP